MPVTCCSVGAAAVAAIYLIYGAYHDYLTAQRKRQVQRHKRVAFLLWRAASQIGGNEAVTLS